MCEDGRFVRDATVELAEATLELPPGDTVRARPVEQSWTDSPPLQAAIAALVLPTQPRVTEIKTRAITLLAAIADKPRVSLDEWISGTPEQQTQVVQAVFAALADLYPKRFRTLKSLVWKLAVNASVSPTRRSVQTRPSGMARRAWILHCWVWGASGVRAQATVCFGGYGAPDLSCAGWLLAEVVRVHRDAAD